MHGLARSGFFRVVTVLWGVCLGIPLCARVAHAQSCQVLRYSFQPDCLRAAPGDAACNSVFYRFDPIQKANVVDRLDLGPQIAVWIESADRARFIDTLMVTNMVAARGIGNRPGLSNFVSSPKFPYGKRRMALPIWAYARGVLYPSVVFQDTNEERIGFHESCSSPDPYYCRPMRSEDIVDAITCPSPVFNSSKGRFDTTLPKSYYPPRNDLSSDPLGFISRDCDALGGSPGCALSAASYAGMNDLDAVAAATPPYGQVYSGTWNIPAALPAGDYLVFVEVNKEFDRNTYHSYPSAQDAGLAGYGLSGNFGQPSVVYRVPIHIEGDSPNTAAQSQIAGYSSWLGDSGSIVPRDGTISSDPGSGEGRLLEIPGPAGMGRVQISLEQCGPVVCEPAPPPPAMVTALHVDPGDITASTAQIRFLNAATAGSGSVSGYEIRYRASPEDTMTAEQFAGATRAPQVLPGLPNTATSVTLDSLKPSTHYVVGIRSQGTCLGQSDIALTSFDTLVMKFTQLSGCFVATAAYGSEMEPEVAALRSVRDDLRARSALFAAAAELYYRSGPAAAAVLRRSDTARTLARRLLAPVASLAEAAQQLLR